jgi:hypothetical protein
VSAEPDLEATILVESYNHEEGSSLSRLFETLGPAVEIARANGSTEVVLADTSDDPELERRLAAEAPEVRRIPVAASHYDDAKLEAAAQSRGRFIVYLDGDCVPLDRGWLDAHLEALTAGSPASAGVTRYEGGFLQRILSVMDFGFLTGDAGEPVDCFASNNVGFDRWTLLGRPRPESAMRCTCYVQARELAADGAAPVLTPRARAAHEIKPFWKERVRRGHDQVAAVWTDPSLPERPLLRLGPLAAPLFYGRDLLVGWRRLSRHRRSFGLSAPGAAAAAALLPVLQLPDLIGLLRALCTPPSRRR